MNRINPVVLVLTFVLTSVLIGCATHGPRAAETRGKTTATGFVDKTMTIDGAERRYVVYVPPKYTPRTKWPLILFLHGAGECGNDNVAQTKVGIGRAIRHWPERFPCIVIMPQCPNNSRGWGDALPHVELALQQTLGEYNIDSRRIYLTGLSMGGSGTWMLGSKKPELFAAMMPICGRGGFLDATTRLVNTPIWVFHGAVDRVVPVDGSRTMVDAIKKAGGNIRYTEYPNEDHNCWDVTYGNKDVIAWLLKQKKGR